MTFNDNQIHTIMILNYATTALNLLGTLFTITTFLIFKEARNGATALVFFLALSDLCTASTTSFLWTLNTHPFFCHLQGFILQFGLCASISWGFMIGVYMFLVLYKNVDLETLEKYRYVFHIICWGYAAVGSLVPLFKKQYDTMYKGHRYSWCWIDDSHSIYRLIFYIPDTIIFFILILLYGLTRRRLRSTQGSFASELCNKMSIYLIVFIFINFFAIINRMQNYIYPNHLIFPLFVLQFLTQPLQGFLNAIAYVWNEPAFIEQYKQLFGRCCTRRLTIAKSIQQAENEKLLQNIIYDDYDKLP